MVDDWSQGDRKGLVFLPSGRGLYLIASGPKRSGTSDPAVVIEHGLGGTASEWVAVQRMVARFARVYSYERAGYHPSHPPIRDPTPANIAADLQTLLRTADVAPPYLLVGHSYGGVLARQFLADFSEDVCGMVIVDSAPIPNRVPGPDNWRQVMGDSTYQSIVGLDDIHALADEEYMIVKRESELNEAPGGIAEREHALLDEHCRVLKERLDGKQVLGTGRLSVIMCNMANDFKKCYEYGVKHGHGSERAREALRKHLETMSDVDEARMREQLVLSSVSRFVRATGKRATHEVHMIDPDFVVKEIEWVYQGTQNSQ